MPENPKAENWASRTCFSDTLSSPASIGTEPEFPI
jgi:hypothetical protein